MYNYLVRRDDYNFALVFLYIRTLHVLSANTQTRLRGSTGSSDPLLLVNAINTKSHELAFIKSVLTAH